MWKNYNQNVISSYDDNTDEPIFQRDEQDKIVTKLHHVYYIEMPPRSTVVNFKVDIAELGPDALGRWPEAYIIDVANQWHDWRFIGTLEEAKALGLSKLKEIVLAHKAVFDKFLQEVSEPGTPSPV